MDYQTNTANEPVRWPFRVDYDKVNYVETDVLVVGGGLAGCAAGISAARSGARVAICDKGNIKRAGSGGAGMDHYCTVLENPKSPMTTEENLENGRTEGRQGHKDYIATKGTWDALLKLESLGLPIRDEAGEFKGSETYDESGILKAYDYGNFVNVKLRGGQYVKPVLYKGAVDAGCEIFNRVMITGLLKSVGRVNGAMGFSLETGEFYVFHAGSVILSCGDIWTTWTSNLELIGNSWRYDPNVIGEGMAMIWKAGGKILNMHKNGHTRTQHPFAWPRFGVGNPYNTWFPCTIVDNNGKEIPWMDADGNVLTSVEARNHKAPSQVYMGVDICDNNKNCKTPMLIKDLPERIKNGEFELPLWADLPSMPEDERRSIWGLMIGNEGKTRYTIYDLYMRSGFNPDKDMLMAPFQIPEGYSTGGWFQGEPGCVKAWRGESFGGQGEPYVDWKLMTSVEGLFAGGSTCQASGVSFACSSGFYVGKRAAEYALENAPEEIDSAQVEAERARVYAPTRRVGLPEAYISWKEMWNGEARVMQQCCADFRSESILKAGLEWMKSLRKNELGHTFARNPHELARLMEVETRMTIGEIFLHGGLSQLGGVPKGSYLFIRLEDGRVLTETREPQYWLKGENAPTYLENYRRATAKEAIR